MKKAIPSYSIKKNPKVDFLFGIFDCPPIPTKQDGYKPINVWQVYEDGTEKVLNDFYVRKPDNNSVKEFHSLLGKVAKDSFPKEKMIMKPSLVEVVISVSVTENRHKLVDVDNLAKTVLDGIKGIAFEDDSQVVSLICHKHIHPMKKNGILVGISLLTDENKGFVNDITLYEMKPNAELLKIMQPIIDKLTKN